MSDISVNEDVKISQRGRKTIFFLIIIDAGDMSHVRTTWNKKIFALLGSH